MITYLSGPIDFAGDNSQNWKEDLVAYFSLDKIVFYDPSKPLLNVSQVQKEDAKFIGYVNSRAVELADVVFVRWMKSTVSVGTPQEIFHALNHKVHTIIVTDMKDSVYINYAEALGAHVFSFMSSAKDHLQSVCRNRKYYGIK